MSAATEIEVGARSLEDLAGDLDGLEHGFCGECYPNAKHFDTIVCFCGKAVCEPIIALDRLTVDDICPKCLSVNLSGRCPRGHWIP